MPNFKAVNEEKQVSVIFPYHCFIMNRLQAERVRNSNIKQVYFTLGPAKKKRLHASNYCSQVVANEQTTL